MPIKLHKWFPVFFLLITWYIPRQTAPGGYLENFIVLRWTTFLLIPVILFCFLLYKFYVDSKIYVTNVIWPIIIIFLVILISAVVNQSSAIATIFTFLIYLRYPLLFVVLLNVNLDESLLKLFLKVFFFLVIIQIPETFYRYFVLGIKSDDISWTLGPWGTFDLGVYMMYATALIVSRSLISRMKLSYFILILIFFLVALFGEIKAFMFFAPLVAGYIIFSCLGMKIPKRRLYVIVAIVSVVVIGFATSISQYERIFPKKTGVKKIRAAVHLEEQKRIGRVSAFSDILQNIEIAPFKLLLGWGPGSSSAGEFTKKRGKIFDFSIKHKNQLAETFVDTGFAGLIVYYWFLFSLFYGFRIHNKIEINTTYIYLNRSLMGMWLFYAFLGPLYDLVWRHDSSQYIFFFLSAVLYSRHRQMKKIKNENTFNQ